jgi:hypothetical protein
MLIGPHVKRGFVSHTLADFGSIIRLIFTVLGLPPLNQFDAAAPLPVDFFADGATDPAPYDVRPPDRRIFDPDQALKPFDRGFNWAQLAASPRLDDPEDMRRPFEEAGTALAGVVMGSPRAAGKAAASPRQ